MTSWIAACQALLSFTISWSLLRFMSIELMMLSNHLILCCLLPSVFPSIRVFSNESALRIRWPKYWSFSISPSSEYSGLIPFRMDWFDLLAVRGTLKSLPQHHSSKTSVLQRSAFFMAQLSHLYLTIGKTMAVTTMDLCQQSDVSAFSALCLGWCSWLTANKHRTEAKVQMKAASLFPVFHTPAFIP